LPGGWARIGPFRNSFTDLDMEIVELVAEGQTVAARFVCSGTHSGDWLGVIAGEHVAEVVQHRLVAAAVGSSW
jgi:predicted ester cyclase